MFSGGRHFGPVLVSFRMLKMGQLPPVTTFLSLERMKKQPAAQLLHLQRFLSSDGIWAPG